MKYVAKRVEVGAHQFLPPEQIPEGVQYPNANLGPMFGLVETNHGTTLISSGDWVLTNHNGEHYPCKDRAFKHKYEKLSEAENQTKG